ncbi:hypothetical protein TNCV_4515761 [Trichonephila clavipes]|nr:hypothetical protein TNCV_4515761 [Trichonephila clavipes]
MPRSGGKSEARPSWLKSPNKLGTYLSTYCSRDERCYAPGLHFIDDNELPPITLGVEEFDKELIRIHFMNRPLKSHDHISIKYVWAGSRDLYKNVSASRSMHFMAGSNGSKANEIFLECCNSYRRYYQGIKAELKLHHKIQMFQFKPMEKRGLAVVVAWRKLTIMDYMLPCLLNSCDNRFVILVGERFSQDEMRALDGENLERALKKETSTVEDRDWSGKTVETLNAGDVGEPEIMNAGGVGGLESMV